MTDNIVFTLSLKDGSKHQFLAQTENDRISSFSSSVKKLQLELNSFLTTQVEEESLPSNEMTEYEKESNDDNEEADEEEDEIDEDVSEPMSKRMN